MAQHEQRRVPEQALRIPINGVTVDGDLAVPQDVSGVVIFAHGSGSSRHSPRNRFVAEVLQRQGLATVLMDLLTPAEERVDAVTRALRFDIGLLAARLGIATDWLRRQRAIAHLEIGYFGASTGAAAALRAAAERPGVVRAVVSRGGRPDLAEDTLDQVQAATLLIVGGDDAAVIPYNEDALAHLRGPRELVMVPGATHLFEEPGALEEVARLAAAWFRHYLGTPEPARERAW